MNVTTTNNSRVYRYIILHVFICISYVQVYPGRRAGGVEADMMAANELNAHTFLQVSYSIQQ